MQDLLYGLINVQLNDFSQFWICLFINYLKVFYVRDNEFYLNKMSMFDQFVLLKDGVLTKYGCAPKRIENFNLNYFTQKKKCAWEEVSFPSYKKWENQTRSLYCMYGN